MALCSTTEVKNHIGISGSTHDTIIGQLIDQVEAQFKRELGVVTVDADTYLTVSNEVVWGTGKLENYTKYKPIRTLTAVEKRDTNRDWTSYTDETVGNIELDEEKNKFYTKYVVAPKGEREMRVSYTCGYKDAEVPDDLSLATILTVVGLFNQRNMVGLKTKTVMGMSLNLDEKDHLTLRRLLAKYRKVAELVAG